VDAWLTSGYSPQNTPHLAPAVVLENALLDLTDKLSSLGLPTTLNSGSDLDRLIPHIESAINDAKIWQFYVFDVHTSVSQVSAAIDGGKAKAWGGEPLAGKSDDELARIAKSTPGFIENYRAWSDRFCTKVQPEVAAGFAQAAFSGENATAAASRWGKILDNLNVDLYAECNEDLKAAKDGILGRLRFTRLDEHGPKIGEINRK
jgi:glycogen debranching enzyme